MTSGAFESMTEESTEPLEFDHDSMPPSIAHRARSNPKRMRVALFFIPLNILILAAFIYWVTLRPQTAAPPTITPDTAAPYEAEENAAAATAPAAPSPSTTAPATDDEKRQVERARLKLSAAVRWRETHPDKARQLAQEAIDIAPQSDVATQAKQLLKQIPR